ADGLTDRGRLAVGVLDGGGGAVDLGLDAVGAVLQRLLHDRAGLPHEQADDQDRGDRAEQQLVALGPDPGVALARILLALLGGGDEQRGDGGDHARAPRFMSSATAPRTVASSGRWPVLSSTTRAATDAAASSTVDWAASIADSASAAAAARRSAIA